MLSKDFIKPEEVCKLYRQVVALVKGEGYPKWKWNSWLNFEFESEILNSKYLKNIKEIISYTWAY